MITIKRARKLQDAYHLPWWVPSNHRKGLKWPSTGGILFGPVGAILSVILQRVHKNRGKEFVELSPKAVLNSLDIGSFRIQPCLFTAWWRHHRMLNLKMRSNLGVSPLRGSGGGAAGLGGQRWPPILEVGVKAISSIPPIMFGWYGADVSVQRWHPFRTNPVSSHAFRPPIFSTLRRHCSGATRDRHRSKVSSFYSAKSHLDRRRVSEPRNIPKTIKFEVSGSGRVTQCTDSDEIWC